MVRSKIFGLVVLAGLGLCVAVAADFEPLAPQSLIRLEWQRTLLERKNFSIRGEQEQAIQWAFDESQQTGNVSPLALTLRNVLPGWSDVQTHYVTEVLLNQINPDPEVSLSDEGRERLRNLISSDLFKNEGDRRLVSELWRDELKDGVSVEELTVLSGLSIISQLRPFISDEEALAEVAVRFSASSAFVWSGTSVARDPAVLQKILEFGYESRIEKNVQEIFRLELNQRIAATPPLKLTDIVYLSSPLTTYDRDKLVRYSDPQELDWRALDSYDVVGFALFEKNNLKCSLPLVGSGMRDELLLWVRPETGRNVASKPTLSLQGNLHIGIVLPEGFDQDCTWEAKGEVNFAKLLTNQRNFNYSLYQFQLGVLKDPLGSGRSVGIANQVAGIRRGLDYHCGLPEDKAWILLSNDSETWTGGRGGLELNEGRISLSWAAVAEAKLAGADPVISVALAKTPTRLKHLKLTNRPNNLIIPKSDVASWFAQELLTDPY